MKNVKIINNLKYVEPIDSTLPKYVKAIEYIPLTNSDKHIINNISKLRIENDILVVGDYNQNKIVVYDIFGNYKYELSHKGHSKEEYLEIANYTITKNNIYILDNYRHRINVYSLEDGSFLKSDKIPFIAWDIEAFDDNDFLFYMIENNPNGVLDIKHNNYAVWRTDSLWNVKEYYLTYEKNYYEMIGKRNYFNRIKDGIVFHSFCTDGYYTFYNNDSIVLTQIEFEKQIPKDIKSDFNKVQNGKYNYLCQTPFLINNYASVIISRDGFEEILLLNTSNGEFVCNPEYNINNSMIYICGIYKNYFVGYIADYDYYNDLVECGFKKADSQIEELLSKGGACLILYEMQ